MKADTVLGTSVSHYRDRRGTRPSGNQPEIRKHRLFAQSMHRTGESHRQCFTACKLLYLLAKSPPAGKASPAVDFQLQVSGVEWSCSSRDEPFRLRRLVAVPRLATSWEAAHPQESVFATALRILYV